MLDRIILFSIRNKLIIGLFTIALIIWGVWSAGKLPIDAVPDITNNQVQVLTVSPSLAAQEVERLITFPVEINMANIPGLQEVRSTSRFGLSVVTIVFTDDTDIYWARQQVSERLKLAIQQIPDGVGTPELAPLTTGLGEIYQYILHVQKGYENKYSVMELRTIQDWIVRRQLLGTKGVAEISSFGGYLKQYEIAIDPHKLRSMNISISQVFAALETNNENAGGAYIDKQPNSWFIRTEGLATGIDDIKKIVVSNAANGSPVLIRDVATVHFGHALRYGAMTKDNQGEVVGAIVMMLKGENSNEVIKNINERIEQIKQNLPEGIDIEAFLDRTKLVNKAIRTVSENLIEGALIVIFVLVLFLGNIRAGLIVASVIPLSMLFAFSMMNLFNVSGNLMSLGAIDFGLIVDGAVIITEATLHHIFNKRFTYKVSQEEMDHEVFESTSRIRNSAAFGEIIILIVYLPILALVGVEGKMFKPMAQTVAFSILGAFILSLTYIPMILTLFLNKKPVHKKNISDKMILFLQKVYSLLLLFALKRKVAVLFAVLILFTGSLFILLRIGGEFIPTLDEGDFAVETRVMPGSSMMQTIDASLKSGKILTERFPDEVIEVIGKIGSSEIPTDPMPMEACDIMIILKDKKEWKQATSKNELANKMQEALEELPGVSFGFQQPIQMRFNELMTGARQDVAIKIYGEDLNLLTGLAKKLGKIVQSVDGVKDLYIEEVTGLPQIVIRFDREKTALFGLNIREMNRIVSTAFAGESAGLIYEGEKRFDLVVRLTQESRQSLEDVRNLFVTTSSGQQVPLYQVAEVDFKVGPYRIQRDDTKRRITVAFNVRGRDVESIVEEIKEKVKDRMAFPAAYYVTYGGQFKNLIEAKKRLAVAVPVAMALIFVLLFMTFNSVKQSVLIFTAIPLSAIGGIFALWLRDMPFSISAGIGFIALFGVAVLNGIVLIGEFNNLKMQGITDLKELVLSGTKTRLRPVLMTAMVASLGFLPMALSQGSGAEVQKPLATVVIGGLFSATLLTLLVLPVLYILTESRSGGADLNFRKKNLSYTILFPFILLLSLTSAVPLQAQPARTVSLDEAILTALQNNSSIKAAQHQINYNQYLKGTSSEIGKTSATFMYGQFNSYFNDNNIALTQTFPFPTLMARQSQLYAAFIKSAEYNRQAAENELTFNVKIAYNALKYFKAKHTLLLSQDSIFVMFLRFSELRFKTGESNSLEKATAESQLYEIRSLIAQNEADILIHQNKLKTLLNIKEEVTSPGTALDKKNLKINVDSVFWNPALKYYSQQILIAEAGRKTEKAKLLPDITMGYFNQSLYGTVNYRNYGLVSDRATRFQGVSLGLAFPLWIKPQISRIKAGEENKKVIQAQFDHFQKNLNGQYTQAVYELQKFRNSLEYYEKNGMSVASVIRSNALKNYQSGNIGYIEFSQGLNRSLAIRQNYLDILSQYNKAIINIEFLTADK